MLFTECFYNSRCQSCELVTLSISFTWGVWGTERLTDASKDLFKLLSHKLTLAPGTSDICALCKDFPVYKCSVTVRCLTSVPKLMLGFRRIFLYESLPGWLPTNGGREYKEPGIKQCGETFENSFTWVIKQFLRTISLKIVHVVFLTTDYCR